MFGPLRRFLLDESGPTAVEYAVMLSLILLACFASIGLLGDNTAALWADSDTELQAVGF